MAKTQIPKDIQENIMELAKAVDTDPKNLVNRLKEIMEEDESILAMGEGTTEEEKEQLKVFKVRFAWSLLYREYTMTGNVEDYYYMPCVHSNPREIRIKGEPTFVGDTAGLIQKLEKEGDDVVAGDMQFAAGTFWRKGAKHLSDLEPGKVYQVSLVGREQDWGLEITSDKAAFTPVDYKMPKTFQQFYDDEIEPRDCQIALSDMDISESKYPTDIRVIETTITDVVIGEKNNRQYGFYNVMDQTIVGGNHTLFMDPRDIVWAQGSIVKFGGTISKDSKTGESRWTTMFSLPTKIAMRRDKLPNITPVDEDEPAEEEEPEEPKPKQEKKTEAKKEESSEESSDDSEEGLFEI